MSTDYKAMLESTSNHQPTVSSPTCTALLCCPFCDGKGELEQINETNQIYGYQVYCVECQASANPAWAKSTYCKERDVISDAINAWNKRAS